MNVHNFAGEPGHDATSDGSFFFVGTATTMIRFGGFSILTDPNFLQQGEKVHRAEAARAAGLEGRVRYVDRGDTLRLPNRLSGQITTEEPAPL